jgi:hypothetical protein
MPRYVIERVYDEAVRDDMASVGVRTNKIATEQFPDITWEHSHVVSDESEIKSFCVYEAPNADRLREHGKELGQHVITHIYEVAADVTPADFAP